MAVAAQLAGRLITKKMDLPEPARPPLPAEALHLLRTYNNLLGTMFDINAGYFLGTRTANPPQAQNAAAVAEPVERGTACRGLTSPPCPCPQPCTGSRLRASAPVTAATSPCCSRCQPS